MNTTATIAAKLAPFQIEMQTVRLLARPDREASEWDAKASHWQCVLSRVGKGTGFKPLAVTYSMGSAHKGAPAMVDVLGSLLLDSRTAGESFADWCAELGYDTDSRKALATYEACAAIAADLRKLFTRDELAQLAELFADY